MALGRWLRSFFKDDEPEHLRRGRLGERAARRHLQRCGLKFLTANHKARGGEIDLVFRDEQCLVFVEVKTRSDESWTTPADAVDAGKRRRLSVAALDYLRLLKGRSVDFRFDIVEVLWREGGAGEVRHWPNAFELDNNYRYD